MAVTHASQFSCSRRGSQNLRRSLAGKTLKGSGGVSLEYSFALSDTPTIIDATVNSVAVNEQTKAIVEARAASVGIANAGTDLAAGQGISSAMASTSAALAPGSIASC
ncbi:MAG: hypothetical protein K6F46_04265 [Desulfovibrio sp.]|nr:hypothetical protein [Desulfovibrio sp.]